MANTWLSKFDPLIRGNAQLFARYTDDILRSIKSAEVQQKLSEINSYHPSLKFTIEEENEDRSLPFLDMLLIRLGTLLASTWYNKPTDTGLIMNYHSLAPRNISARLLQALFTAFFMRVVHGSTFILALKKLIVFWKATNTHQTSVSQ